MTDIFNPQKFFDKASHYASQGRGLFTLLGERPLCIPKNTTTNAGWGLLSQGIMAKSVQTPGHNLATFEEFSFSGPTRKHAHTQLFGALTVEFFMMGRTPEEARSIYQTFVSWHEGIAGPDNLKNQVNRVPISDSTLFSIAYYSDYVSEAELKIFSPMTESPIIHDKFYEIYPQAIGGINTSWESQDVPMTLSVTFEYFYTQSAMDSRLPTVADLRETLGI